MSDTEALEDQFRALDKDGSGCVSPEELLALMPGSLLRHAKEVLAMLDTDGDGRISLDEFMTAYSSEDA